MNWELLCRPPDTERTFRDVAGIARLATLKRNELVLKTLIGDDMTTLNDIGHGEVFLRVGTRSTAYPQLARRLAQKDGVSREGYYFHYLNESAENPHSRWDYSSLPVEKVCPFRASDGSIVYQDESGRFWDAKTPNQVTPGYTATLTLDDCLPGDVVTVNSPAYMYPGKQSGVVQPAAGSDQRIVRISTGRDVICSKNAQVTALYRPLKPTPTVSTVITVAAPAPKTLKDYPAGTRLEGIWGDEYILLKPFGATQYPLLRVKSNEILNGYANSTAYSPKGLPPQPEWKKGDIVTDGTTIARVSQVLNDKSAIVDNMLLPGDISLPVSPSKGWYAVTIKEVKCERR